MGGLQETILNPLKKGWAAWLVANTNHVAHGHPAVDGVFNDHKVCGPGIPIPNKRLVINKWMIAIA